jgi:hypothetical protein
MSVSQEVQKVKRERGQTEDDQKGTNESRQGITESIE